MRIRDRNFMLISGLVIATFVIVAAVLFSNFNNTLTKTRNISFAVIRSSLVQKFEDKTQQISRELAEEIEPLIARNDTEAVASITKAARNQPETVFACLYDPSGRIITDGTGLSPSSRNIKDLFGLSNIQREGIMWNADRSMLYSVSPVMMNGLESGGICIVRSAGYVENALASLRDVLRSTDMETFRSTTRFLIFVAVMLLVLVILSSYAVALRISKPVKIISGLIERVGKGDYDIELPFNYSDEIGDLARSLQTTAKTIKETTVSRDDLRDILQSMHDGVIVVDGEGIIQDVNKALTTLLDCPASKLLNMHIESVLSLLNENGQSSWEEFLNSELIRDREISFTSSGGKQLYFSLNVSPLSGEGEKNEGAVFVFNDITEHRYLEKKLRHNALHDSLTGLPNRTMMRSKLDKILQRYLHDGEGASFDVLFLDLDRFKNINDNLGHGMGDEVLKVVAQRLVNLTRPFDLVSRFGGDEFVIILDNKGKPSAAETVAKRLIEGISKPVTLQGRQIYITGSIGIVNSCNGGNTSSDFLANSDRAMYAAKARGKGQAAVYNASLMQGKDNLLVMETELRKAIEENRIEVYYQPVVSTKENRIVGFEALARWKKSKDEMALPGEFISLAEETGLILPLGRIVMEKALDQLSKWNRAFPNDSFFMSVNISAPLFTDHDLYGEITNALEESGISPSRLILEITESMIITNPSFAVDILSRLKEKGLKLAIDDFGTGYSSLSFLHYFPFDLLKIDKSFISNMSQNINSQKIVKGIADLAHNLDMELVAEGVEKAEDLEQITSMGCQFYQGYFTSPPLSPDSMAKLLRNRARLTYLNRDMKEIEQEEE